MKMKVASSKHLNLAHLPNALQNQRSGGCRGHGLYRIKLLSVPHFIPSFIVPFHSRNMCSKAFQCGDKLC